MPAAIDVTRTYIAEAVCDNCDWANRAPVPVSASSKRAMNSGAFHHAGTEAHTVQVTVSVASTYTPRPRPL